MLCGLGLSDVRTFWYTKNKSILSEPFLSRTIPYLSFQTSADRWDRDWLTESGVRQFVQSIQRERFVESVRKTFSSLYFPDRNLRPLIHIMRGGPRVFFRLKKNGVILARILFNFKTPLVNACTKYLHWCAFAPSKTKNIASRWKVMYRINKPFRAGISCLVKGIGQQ